MPFGIVKFSRKTLLKFVLGRIFNRIYLESKRGTKDIMNTGSVVKICTVCVMLLYSLAFSTLPFFTQIFNKGANAINLANCFSAGVLLSVALLHILPNADELLWKSNGEVGGGFPWPFCCTIISYTMVLILDKCFIQSNACLASQKSGKIFSYEN